MNGLNTLKNKISKVIGRMVFDSRGIPTVEAEVFSQNGFSASAIAPAGASKGKKEAYEKRDNNKHYNGLSVLDNIELINNKINKELGGLEVEDQKKIDQSLIKLDGTKDKSSLGANTIVAISMANLKLAALCNKKYLWEHLKLDDEKLLPLPQVQIIGGGKHAKDSLSVQDFLIIPNGASTFKEALEWVFKIYMLAGAELAKNNILFGVADEGGYWPSFKTNEKVLSFLTELISKAGFEPFKQISIAIDIAANNFKVDNLYKLNHETNMTKNQLLSTYLEWIRKYPIISIEDPFAEEDFMMFKKLKERSPSYLQIVGDDLVVTHATLIKQAKTNNSINTVLIKPNQVGTITETLEALDVASSLDLLSILSARSGETEDTIISDLCVGWSIKQLKVGSFSRSERLAKWNQCLRIGENLKNNYLMHKIEELNWNKL